MDSQLAAYHCFRYASVNLFVLFSQLAFRINKNAMEQPEDWQNIARNMMEGIILNDLNEYEYSMEEQPYSDNMQPDKMLNDISKEHSFTEKGLKAVTELMQHYGKHRKADYIVSQYPHLCLKADSLFLPAVNNAAAATILLQLVKKIVTPVVNKTMVSESSPITSFELDIVEYIAGFTIRKVRIKFPSHLSVVNLICSNKPSGCLIKLLEKDFKLEYPSENYMFLLQHIYTKMTIECNKSPASIDFTAFRHQVLNDSSFLHLVDHVSNEADNSDAVENILTHAVTVFVKALSYAFAKKLFLKLSIQLKTSRYSLRKNLKTL